MSLWALARASEVSKPTPSDTFSPIRPCLLISSNNATPRELMGDVLIQFTTDTQLPELLWRGVPVSLHLRLCSNSSEISQTLIVRRLWGNVIENSIYPAGNHNHVDLPLKINRLNSMKLYSNSQENY